jgi:hypothetical protein
LPKQNNEIIRKLLATNLTGSFPDLVEMKSKVIANKISLWDKSADRFKASCP